MIEAVRRNGNPHPEGMVADERERAIPAMPPYIAFERQTLEQLRAELAHWQGKPPGSARDRCIRVCREWIMRRGREAARADVPRAAASGRVATDEEVHAAGFSKHDAVAIRIKLAAAGMRVVVEEAADGQ